MVGMVVVTRAGLLIARRASTWTIDEHLGGLSPECVAVDLRRSSPNFGRWEAHELSDENQRQLFVPVGFGHGFLVLTGEADVIYRLSSYYDPETEAGIAWNDPDVGIEWPATGYLISDRDQQAPRLAEVRDSLPW